MSTMLQSLRQKLANVLSPGHSEARWVDASVQRYDTSGIDKSAYWGFDYRLCMEAHTSWVYRCAMGNAQRAASIPIKLYVRDKSVYGKSLAWGSKKVGKQTIKRLQTKGSAIVRSKAYDMDDGMVELTEHPILDLLSKSPNDWYNGYEMMTWAFLCLELAGNAYFYKQRNPALNRIVGLYPMLPQWVLVKPGQEGSGKLIDGYAYGQFTARKRVTDYTTNEVMHCRYPNPKNLYYGMGKVEAAWDILGLTKSQRVAYRAIFDNGFNPGAIVGIEGLQNDDQARQAEGRINSILRGVRNAGKVLVLGGKTTMMQPTISPKDISTNESALEEIAAVFGYPVTMLLAKDQGKANAESGETTWLKHTIDPMLRTMEQWLNQQLLPEFGDEVAQNACLAFNSPIEADDYREEESLAALVQAGIVTPNEARNTLGKESIEGQDELRVSMPTPAPAIDKKDAEKGCSVRLRSYP